MRVLSDREAMLVAGGWGSSDYGYYDWWDNYDSSWYGVYFDNYEQTVVVTGPSWQPDWSWLWSTGGGSGGGGDPGGNGGSGGGETAPEALPTPCVEASPGGVALQSLNNMALAMTNKIASEHADYSTYEFGVILYTLNGELASTPVFSSHSDSEINWNLGVDMLPNGAVIVGILHNHPDEPGIDDTIPSLNTMQHPGGHDWQAFDSFLTVSDRNSRGITTDPNMLMYIMAHESGDPLKTYVYDKTDKNTTHHSCSLQ
jgi:hypothetical protein